MPLELRHLRAFVVVAEELNFRKAAERLQMAQPALSRTIMDAEAQIGIRLFERSTRVVRPTPGAASLLPAARAILAGLDQAVRTARRVDRGELGTVLVGYNDFAINGLLPAILMRFRREHPGIHVSLRSLTSPEMAEMIRARSLDVGFMTGAHLASDLASVAIQHERIVCLLPKGHALAERDLVSLRDLAEEPFVMGTRAGWSTYIDVVDRFCQSQGFRPRIIHEAEFSDGIVGLVAAGMGVSLYVEGQWLHTRDDVVVRTLAERPPAIATIAAWHPDLQSPVLANFVGAIRAEAAHVADQAPAAAGA